MANVSECSRHCENLMLSSKGKSYLENERKMLGVYQVANKRRVKIEEE